MGNQACQPNKGPSSYESTRSRSFIGDGHHKNRHIYREEDQPQFPELPTLGDDSSSLKMSKFREIQNTRIKASAAKKRKPNMDKSYSIQDLEHSNPSTFTTRTTRVHENDQSHSFRNVSQTYRSDQTAPHKRRNQSFCIFSESNNQTNRRFQQNIVSESLQDKDISKNNSNTSRNYKQNSVGPQANFEYSREKMNQKFAEPSVTYRHKKNFSCSLENNQSLDGEYERPSLDTSDPIQLYLKRFTAANNMDYRSNEKYIQIDHDAASRNHRDSMQVNRMSFEGKKYPQANDHKMVGKPQEEVCDRQIYNLTFECPGSSKESSSKETIPSESNLFSDPEVNETFQIALEAKRLCNYDIPNTVMLINHQKLRNESLGSRNLTSITEFDQENYAKFHSVDSRPSLNGGLLSRQNIDNISTKSNSVQDLLQISRHKPFTTAERSFSSLSSLDKMQSFESTAVSDFSPTPSLSTIQTKENEQNKRIQIENYYSNPNIQISQYQQLQINTSFLTSNVLQNDNYRGEKQSQDNFLSQKAGRNLFERIPTVPECVQETDQSVDTFVDTLNRTNELSMMSPTNIESNYLLDFSPLQNQKRTSSPDRDSLRQYALSKTLKKTPIPAEDMLVYPSGFVLNTRNMNCPDNGYGIALSHLNYEDSTKFSQNSDSERQNKQYVRRYNSAIDCSKKENKFGS